MKIVILGGSGSLGMQLARRLIEAKHEVVIGSRSRPNEFGECWKACDVTQPASIDPCLQGADLVYNLAAAYEDNIRPLRIYRDINVTGAENVCAAAERCGVRRIVFTSTVAIYGSASKELDETAPANPENEYGRTKYEAEKVYRQWLARTPSGSLTVVRPTAIFGEGTRGNVYNLLKAIQSKHFFVIGSGRNCKSLAYVGNVAAFLVYVIGLPAGEATFNYIDKPDLSVNELVILVRKALGRKAAVGPRMPYFLGWCIGAAFDCLGLVLRRNFSISAQRMRKFVTNTQFASRRAMETGFTPEVPFEEAVRRTVVFEFLQAGAQ